MEKKKISLSTLKVKSFVTDLENDNSQTIKGGGGFLSIFGCNTCEASCGCVSQGCQGGTSSGGETCGNTV